jgi:hypothetical protein
MQQQQQQQQQASASAAGQLEMLLGDLRREAGLSEEQVGTVLVHVFSVVILLLVASVILHKRM